MHIEVKFEVAGKDFKNRGIDLIFLHSRQFILRADPIN